MPPFQWTADNVTEVAIAGHWTNSRDVVTVLHVRREEDDPAQSARDVLNNWQDHIVPAMQDNYSVDGCHYTDHNALGGATGFVAVDPAKAIVGGHDADSASVNCAVLVHKRISAHTGVRSGRMYLPPTRESWIDENGILHASYIAEVQPALNSFLDGVSGPDDNELVVVHKTPATGGNSDISVVSALTLDPLIATMRRRIRR